MALAPDDANISLCKQILFWPKSIPDAKRSDRFYTSIRLPRDL